MDIIKLDMRTDSSATVYLPHALYRNTLNKVSFSAKDVTCQFVEIDEDKCYLSEDLWEKLSIPFPMSIRAEVFGEALHFLPVIGLFTTGYTFGSLYPFGQRTNEYRRLLSFAEKNGGCAFFVTPEHFDWESETVKGIFYRQGKWSESNVAFPQVIYDRVPNRKQEQLSKVIQVKEKLQKEYGIPWFNPGFFDKWDILDSLQKHPISVQYLPKTFDLSVQTLKRSLETYPSIYIKPKKASHGIGIKHLRKVGNSILCQENKRSGSSEKKYGTMIELLKEEFKNHHPSQYILQQGVDLPEMDGKQYDFRIHTNKDRMGKWQLSAVAAKAGGDGTITTHVAYGGEIKTLGEVYGKKKAGVILDQLKDAAISISEVIDQQTDGLIGELGLDLVVDREDRIWLFEANAKPGRMIFTNPAIRKQARLVDRYWLDYCTHLSELGIKKPQWLLSMT
ncbi:MAG: YheC/YheD family protein [Tuberibacillus sp.]